ncbi:expressed protein [Batrachochytrium dendrobatidis JAM81]|uniref:Expressed protein n=1 Tax=Batrachochytrium dendrobatidis (strain JAM81 / FGSC 10211) TaxID=684364 RepID=F4P345_BATDJ|nr:uncharacterized protein BATDEDRAFT_24977 [Batrachochytrium dendrobatidis JAM81]EGF80418.1 expressed protein [Batrachochytrium dendrobatidis JAM81]|eukprot:XP_006678976.1 expressed protein [Batrachochytrium dendrobatidis JAM81]
MSFARTERGDFMLSRPVNSTISLTPESELETGEQGVRPLQVEPIETSEELDMPEETPRISVEELSGQGEERVGEAIVKANITLLAIIGKFGVLTSSGEWGIDRWIQADMS